MLVGIGVGVAVGIGIGVYVGFGVYVGYAVGSGSSVPHATTTNVRITSVARTYPVVLPNLFIIAPYESATKYHYIHSLASYIYPYSIQIVIFLEIHQYRAIVMKKYRSSRKSVRLPWFTIIILVLVGVVVVIARTLG